MLLTGMLCFCSLGVRLNATDISLSIREVCRRRISGEYLSIYDLKVRLDGLVQKQEKQIANVLKTTQNDQNKLSVSKKQLSKDPFNTNLANQVSLLQGKLNASQALLQEIMDYQSKIKSKQMHAKEQLRALEKSFGGVLRLKPVKQKNLGYPFQLAYSRDCPKFQDGCPLTAKERKSMEMIFQSTVIKEIKSCKRYMNQQTG